MAQTNNVSGKIAVSGNVGGAAREIIVGSKNVSAAIAKSNNTSGKTGN